MSTASGDQDNLLAMSTMSTSDDTLAFMDFSAYDNAAGQSSLIASPCTEEVRFTGSSDMTVTPPTLPMNQTFTGPSHQYDMYKQQTPLVPGALADTLAMNESLGNFGYSANNGLVDYSPLSSQNPMTGDMGMEFENPTSPSLYMPSSHTIDPQAIELASPLYRTNSDDRVYPGVHQHNAAMAKARNQEAHLAGQANEQPQNAIGYQFQQPRQQTSPVLPEGPADVNTVREETITQLIGQMRSRPSQSTASTSDSPDPVAQSPHLKRDDDDMDEDERLLNSEEGKKLSPKERRQLRNKVSARAFRFRRKEYISTLESDLARMAREHKELKDEIAILKSDNDRLTKLTSMFLKSEHFAHFIGSLKVPTNPATVEHSQPQPAQQPVGTGQYMPINQRQQHLGQHHSIQQSLGQQHLGQQHPVGMSVPMFDRPVR